MYEKWKKRRKTEKPPKNKNNIKKIQKSIPASSKGKKNAIYDRGAKKQHPLGCFFSAPELEDAGRQLYECSMLFLRPFELSKGPT